MGKVGDEMAGMCSAEKELGVLVDSKLEISSVPWHQ